MTTNRISASEAAARLGVKRETIYAYVSRGMLESIRDIDGKTSTFDPDEIARIMNRRRGARRGHLEVPISTAITKVTDGSISYRGHNLTEIVAHQHRFESVASLLWTGTLDDAASWGTPDQGAGAPRTWAPSLGPGAISTDLMMAAVIARSTVDPFRNDRSAANVMIAGATIITAMVEALPRLATAPSSDHLAQCLWQRLTDEDDAQWPLLDLALVLLADHGMATSTLASRIAASTRAGVHSVVLAGLGTVVGPLHGGASRLVHLMFADAEQRGADAAIAEVLRHGDRIPGLGHMIHRSSDPRHDLLFDALGRSTLDPRRADAVAAVVARISERYEVAPNVDLALGALTYMSGMSADSGEVIFALARTSGWIAHALEEYQEAPLRFRPVGRYCGPIDLSS